MSIRSVVLVAGLALAACTTPANTPRPEFGQAVRNNMAAHIIDPNPWRCRLRTGSGGR
jgi:hypothetical protein